MREELKTRIESIKNINLKDFCVDFDHQDIIDSRDIQERIDELTGEFETYLSDLEDAEGEDEIETAEDDLESWLSENEDEYVSLMAFKEEVEGYTSDWKYGATIIADTYFEDYARQLAEDIGAIDRNASWPNDHIDWKSASEALQQDYSEITFDRVSYWVR